MANWSMNDSRRRRGQRPTAGCASRSTSPRSPMPDQPHRNVYRNASTPPPAEAPDDLAAVLVAIDPILAAAAELARVVAVAHQAACTQLIGPGWAYARKFFSLSEKYADWADYRVPAVGTGIHAYAHAIDHPLRLTDAELRAHPAWRGFGTQEGQHPPMRGWLMAPLIGADGENYGFVQASDRLEGEFTELDELNLVRLATLTSHALDAEAQLHLAAYRARVEAIKRPR